MSIFQLSSTVLRGAKNADGSIDTFERGLCGMGKGAFRDNGSLAEFSVPKDHYPIECENHLFDNCPNPDGKLAQLL